jgi:hypothetical protein
VPPRTPPASNRRVPQEGQGDPLALMRFWESKEESVFFFEKKKQKTFIHCRRHGARVGELGTILNR